MRQLVRDEQRDRVRRRRRGARRIDEHAIVAQEDGAGVLHAAGGERRHGDEVELGERIGPGEPVAEARQQRRGGVEREARQRQLGRRGAITRTGVPPTTARSSAKRPTASATRYGGSGAVSAKRTRCGAPPSGVRSTMGVFDTASSPASISTVRAKRALCVGPVEAGKDAARARRLEVGEQRAPGARAGGEQAAEIVAERAAPGRARTSAAPANGDGSVSGHAVARARDPRLASQASPARTRAAVTARPTASSVMARVGAPSANAIVSRPAKPWRGRLGTSVSV